MLLPCVGQRRADAGDAQTLGAAVDELQLVGVDIAGEDLAPIPAVHGHGKGLAAGSGAHVQHPILLGRGGHGGHQTGGCVLHGESALPEGGQLLQIAGAADGKASRQPRVGLHLCAGLAQQLLQLLRGTL